jgi:uncharacterized protein (DUF3820 family)
LNPDILKKIIVTPMPYGKYKGTMICDIPVHYLEWMYAQGFPKGSLGMMLHTIHEIKINGLDHLLIPLKQKR